MSLGKWWGLGIVIALLELSSKSVWAQPSVWIEWQGQKVEVVPNEYLVVSDGLTGLESVQRVLVSDNVATQAAFASIAEQFPDAAWIQPNFIYRAIRELPEPPSFADYALVNWLGFAPAFLGPEIQTIDERWDMDLMDVAEAHHMMSEKKLWNSETTIAVLDTGFYSAHPALKNKIKPYSIYGVQFYSGGKVYTSPNEYEPPVQGARPNPKTGIAEPYTVVGGWHDWAGHGTHCAGTAAGLEIPQKQFRGVAPGYRVMPVKVLDDEGMGSSAQILQGLYYARDQGARIFSMSLGGPGSDRVAERAYADMEKSGVIVIAAAGNDYEQNNPTFYPAAFSSTLAVASLGSDGWISYFSEAGDWVDVAAPGGDGHKRNHAGSHRQVFSTFTADPRATRHAGRDPLEPGEDGKYYVGMSGTSMATPHVSGLVALLKSARPNLTLSQVRKLLQESGTKPAGSYDPRQLRLMPQVRSVSAVAALKKLLGLDENPPGPTPGPGPDPVPDPVVGGPWSGLNWIAQPALPAVEITVEKVRIHLGIRQDLVWQPPSTQRLDLSDAIATAQMPVSFGASVQPGDDGSTAYLDLMIRVQGVLQQTRTVFFRRLAAGKKTEIYAWKLKSESSAPDSGLDARLEIFADSTTGQYQIRVVL